MVEYSEANVRLSDTQLKKLNTAVKDNTGTTLRINLKMFDGNNLPHELLLRILSIFIKQISRSINEIPLAKNVLAPLGITAAASALDTGIQKKYVDLGQQL